MNDLIPNHDKLLDVPKDREEDRYAKHRQALTEYYSDARYWASEGLARPEHDICQQCGHPYGDEVPECPNAFDHYPNRGRPTGRWSL